MLDKVVRNNNTVRIDIDGRLYTSGNFCYDLQKMKTAEDYLGQEVNKLYYRAAYFNDGQATKKQNSWFKWSYCKRTYGSSARHGLDKWQNHESCIYVVVVLLIFLYWNWVMVCLK